jgi:methionine sulfoxide reductase heme-binding subunit
LKRLAFCAALVPLLWLIAAALGLAGLSLGPNPSREMLHFTGKTALNLLWIGLLASPLQRLTGEVQWIRPRRIIGLFAFGYALLHFVIYAALELGLDFSDLAREIVKRPFIIVGTLALLLLVPLAVTSTDRMMRRLGRRWQTVHRLVYPATILAVWHFWWQVKKDLTEPMLYAAALALLLGFRWWRAQALRNAQASNTQRGT